MLNRAEQEWPVESETVSGHPIAVYDNGGETFDRYTVVFLDQPNGAFYNCLGMSREPFHPQGFGQHSDCMVGDHLGKLISFAKLPRDCRAAVLQEWSD